MALNFPFNTCCSNEQLKNVLLLFGFQDKCPTEFVLSRTFVLLQSKWKWPLKLQLRYSCLKPLATNGGKEIKSTQENPLPMSSWNCHLLTLLYFEGFQPQWYTFTMISRVSDQNGVSLQWYRGFPTRMVYLYNDIEGFHPEWCTFTMISRVSDQNGVPLQYRGFPSRMVYLHHILCLRYTILVGNPQYIVEIYHSRRKPSIYSLC